MKAEKGATLMEVLIALAITAMIAAGVTQMTGFGLRVVERGERASADTVSALQDERLLRDALTRADGAFEGEPSEIRWRGAGPDDDASAWRLDAEGRIAACDADGCGQPQAWISASIERFAYAGADGNFAESWSGERPPHLISIDFAGRNIVIAPRIRGAE